VEARTRRDIHDRTTIPCGTVVSNKLVAPRMLRSSFRNWDGGRSTKHVLNADVRKMLLAAISWILIAVIYD
jgi:hypothetical protein